MPYFDSKDRTVFSPQCEILEPFYKLLEKYHQAIGGSNLFEEMIETYEFLDFALKKREENNNELITANRTNGS